jgi:hypothetical protein
MPSHRGDQKRLEKKKKKRQLAQKQRAATASARSDVPTGDLAGIAGESVPAFLKFIEPLMHDGATEDEVRYAINVGAQLSAIALLPEAEREEHIATLMKTVGVGGPDAQAEFRALAQTMIERHHTMFPNAHPGKPLLLEGEGDDEGDEESEGNE